MYFHGLWISYIGSMLASINCISLEKALGCDSAGRLCPFVAWCVVLMRANEPLDTAHVSSWAGSRLSKDEVPHIFLSQTNLTIIPSNKEQYSAEFQILASSLFSSHYLLIYMSSTVCGVWDILCYPDISLCFRVSCTTLGAPVALTRSPWTVMGA